MFTRRHKESGDTPYAPGTRVQITEYVHCTRYGTIVSRYDTDSPDSYNWFIYDVDVDEIGMRQFTEFEVTDSI